MGMGSAVKFPVFIYGHKNTVGVVIKIRFVGVDHDIGVGVGEIADALHGIMV